MTKFHIQGTGKIVDLTKNNFITRGGEGDIHKIGDIIYKVTTESKMIPFGKMTELSQLQHSNIIVPQDIILKNNTPYGYTMKAVPKNPIPLAKLLPKGYREREKIHPKDIWLLVQQMITGIKYIHNQGVNTGDYLQVDGNELNYMVTSDHKSVYFIDVNSYQTPTYPADAIMLSIRDWSIKNKNGQLQ